MNEGQIPLSSKPATAAGAKGPGAEAVLQNLPEANGSPLEFLNEVLNKHGVSREEAPAVTVVTPKPYEAPIIEPVATDNPVIEADPVASTETTETNVKNEEPIKELEEDDVPLETVSDKNPLKESLKKVKKNHYELKQRAKELEENNKQLTQALEDIKTGKVTPEYVEALQNKTKELEKYQIIHSLKTSDMYQEQYLKPLEEVKGQIKELAVDYGVPEENLDRFINQAMSFKSQRQLSEFLEDHFTTLDAIKMNELIGKAKVQYGKLKEAELEPARVLNQLEEQGRAARIAKEAERLSKIATNSRSAFEKSLQNIRKEGKLLEVIPRPSDSEFNKNIVEKITSDAAIEFGKVTKRLAELGLEDLPEDVATYLAQMSIRGHASISAAETRNLAVNELNSTLEKTARRQRYERPPVGSMGARGGGGAPQRPQDPQKAIESTAENLINTGRQYAGRR